jgi:quinohemoprotein ethanol dehydrogenase
MQKISSFLGAIAVFVGFALSGCGGGTSSTTTSEKKGTPEHIKAVTNAVDDEMLKKQLSDSKNWLSYGLNYSENRFSGLNQITTENVKDLGLVWSYDLAAVRGVEASPIVVDGIMYLSGPWSLVYAIDVRSGKELWKYDPKVPKSYGEKACCDVVNRGVALYKGKVFVASLDGRLIALNAVNGEKIWEQLTVDQTKPYTITGAPRVVKGKVIIGNGGAEYGVRGYITAYDAETGKQAWRFYSVPGDPSKPFEDKAMEMAAKTWDKKGEWWKAGGGGTMWDAMAYDPELNLFYVGTGNGSPWNRRHRSPGGGDNLFVSSIVALNPDNGEYKWHYQTTPGDHWDYTATQHLILADLKIGGKDRKVIMQAPKNGFFFVIDRSNGEFISAKNFVNVNWATGYDEKGRPQEIEEALYKSGAYEAIPGPYGAHNWHPMAFNPQTGLVYIPAQGVPIVIEDDKDWQYNSTATAGPHNGVGWNTGVLASAVPPKSVPFGHLLAWDPINQKAAWKVEHVAPWNGGVLTTAGNLVFQGTADGRIVAYNAKSGEKLWESPTGTGVIAAPITYEVDGKQYVSIAAGWGGVYGLGMAHSATETPGKVYTFAIGGKEKMPEFQKVQAKPMLDGIEIKATPAEIQLGGKLYINNCVFCHGVPGVGGGRIPNLGYSDKAKIENLDKYVLEGILADRGMPNFKDRLKKEDVEKIKAFIQVTVMQVKQQMEMAKAKAMAK